MISDAIYDELARILEEIAEREAESEPAEARRKVAAT